MSSDSENNLTFTTLNQSVNISEILADLRQEKIRQLRDSLREGQQKMADWESGALAVSAVPGAGKSHSMAVAAALVIAREQLHSRRQLIICTLTRSAAANIKVKIRECLKELSLPYTGFVVYTLHGLALNIAGKYRELSGLNLENSTLILPTPSHRLIRTCVEKWITLNQQHYGRLLEGNQFDGEETERLRRQSVLRTEVLPNLAHTVIREAKSSGLLPQDLWNMSSNMLDHYNILALSAGLYQQYQKLLLLGNYIDYDEMILGALRVLKNASIRKIWQKQVFAVFEDEAQDSSPLQTQLLNILAADFEDKWKQPNLVRVGDPNQAINSTFTPADPKYFREFCRECEAQNLLERMDQAGRSNKIIIDAANFILDWGNTYVNKLTTDYDPDAKVGKGKKELAITNSADALFWLQNIRTVAPGDPQPNPEPVGKGLEIYTPKDIYHSVQLIGDRVISLFEENPASNAAILVRENRQARFLAENLAYLHSQHDIKVFEVGESDRHSHVPREILALLKFLDRPHSPDYLKAALEVLVKRQLIPTQDLNALATFPEQFLYPGLLEAPQTKTVMQARRYCCNLLRAKLELPNYHLISFLAFTLSYDSSELATAEKLAERLGQQTSEKMSMNATLEVLSEIVRAEKFESVETEGNERRYTNEKQLTIITMHKAKGLDWDYVFIPFLHEDTIPGSPWVPTGAQFLGDFSLAEVARVQIRAYLHQQLPLPTVNEAWKQAAYLKTAEEFRLLYVAMTRAKKLLWISAEVKAPFRWNTFTGKQADNLQNKKPCPIIPALQNRFPECKC